MRDSAILGQTALVTGASRGIGRAIALRLAGAGARVVATGRDASALAEVAAAADGELTMRPCDLTDRAALAEMLGELDAVDIVVNNAGWAPPRTALHHMRAEDLQRTLEVCLWAPIEICRRLLPQMLERDSGAIVQILSPAARLGRARETGYAAAKAGLRGFTESLREEVGATDIRVCSLYPGYVDTAFVPANRKVDRARFLQPDDVAEAVLGALTASHRCCPSEITLEPLSDPLSRR